MFRFIVDAVHLIAADGWRRLPAYRFEPETGLWHHRERRREATLRLADLRFADGRLEVPSDHLAEPETALAGYLESAREILSQAAFPAPGCGVDEVLDGELEPLRWFPLSGAERRR
ncbi:MAG TPA: hypothetical protein VLT32_00965 [Candidatus Sulfomarinibacteraceae bacterium]|nr:hypothetical protein [Candidatus Sulfomarinibacteraceae bacterium]